MATSLRERHAESTRRALLRAARALFVRRGYEATGVDEIAAKAGATRGAFYHHFESKQKILLALLEEMQGELAARVARSAVGESDPHRRLHVAVQAFLDACSETAVRRIVLEESPAALGWDVWREIDARHYLGQTTLAVREVLVQEGLQVDAELVARLLLGTLTEAVLWMARSPAADARQQVETALRALLPGLFAPPAP